MVASRDVFRPTARAENLMMDYSTFYRTHTGKLNILVVNVLLIDVSVWQDAKKTHRAMTLK